MKGEVTGITGNLNGSIPFSNATSPDAANPDGDEPKAYLSILFFDERFNYVDGGQLRVEQAGSNAPPLELINLKAPKNGYAYVYVSNESEEHVYFDNIQVAHKRGRIIEENHYYSYGLKIAAISSKKLGNVNEGHLKNGYLYNDKELIDEADLEWYDYGFRNYDPQIGRFPSLDPLTWDYPELTNYQYASNDPIANIDLDGLEGSDVLQNLTIYANKARQAANAGQVFRSVTKITQLVVDMVQYTTQNPDFTTSTFSMPSQGTNSPMTIEEGGQTYHIDGFYQDITYHHEMVNPTVDADIGKAYAQQNAMAELAEKGRYKLIKFGAGVSIYQNGYGQIYKTSLQQGLGNQDGGSMIFDGLTLGGAGAIRQVATNGINKVARSKSVLGHIFRSADGHVNPSTITSQERYIKLFEKIGNNSKNVNPNVLTNFQRNAGGFQGYSKTFRNGKQVWVQSINNKIINAGVNFTPR